MNVGKTQTLYVIAHCIRAKTSILEAKVFIDSVVSYWGIESLIYEGVEYGI